MTPNLIIDPCNVSSLNAFVATPENPWDESKIRHIFRRLGFGIGPTELAKINSNSANALIEQLLDGATNKELLDPLAWNDFTQEDYQQDNGVSDVLNAWRTLWVRSILEGNGVNEKFFLFWHNHFVTQLETYFCLPWMYEYHQIIHDHSFGNFKEFVKAMGKTPAMLLFLNGIQNTVIAPNENYARELYELFTLGRDNGYTQDDIKETARALTGFQGFNSICNPVDFVELSHDKGEKTIFGQTGNWGYDDVHDILFEQRGSLIANYICEKIYSHFVSPDINYSITAVLAQTFQDADFELLPVYKQLFLSDHFFNAAVPGSIIKSPLVFTFGMMKEMELEVSDELILQGLLASGGLLGQRLYSPVDVAGWPGDRTWIDTEKITLRWAISDLFLVATYEQNQEVFRQIVKSINAEDNDVEEVVANIISYFTAFGLHNDIDFREALNTFKSDIPENYFEDGSWNLNWDTVPIQTAQLFSFLFKLPEFQLA